MASAFNCLEFLSPDVTPEHGITGYEHDRTQGPACSIACGAATVLRNYLVRVDAGHPRGQRHDAQLNTADALLSALGAAGGGLAVRSGYMLAPTEALEAVNEFLSLSDTDTGALVATVKAGVHSDIQARSRMYRHALECTGLHSGTQARSWMYRRALWRRALGYPGALFCIVPWHRECLANHS